MLSRLSDDNIPDPIIRHAMYRELLTSDQTDWVTRSIATDEEYRPDIISYRLYGTPECRWLILLIAGVVDEIDPLPVGSSFLFPPKHEIRKKIKAFSG
jgi:hypothetical protein